MVPAMTPWSYVDFQMFNYFCKLNKWNNIEIESFSNYKVCAKPILHKLSQEKEQHCYNKKHVFIHAIKVLQFKKSASYVQDNISLIILIT